MMMVVLATNVTALNVQVEHYAMFRGVSSGPETRTVESKRPIDDIAFEEYCRYGSWNRLLEAVMVCLGDKDNPSNCVSAD